ncbi:MAG TPA: hypothetical protein VGH37_19095, partial [Candidatus Acidoferrum sp.]
MDQEFNFLGISNAVQQFSKSISCTQALSISMERQASQQLSQLITQRDRAFGLIENTGLFHGITQANKAFERVVSTQLDQIFAMHTAIRKAAEAMSSPVLAMLEVQRQLAVRLDQWQEPLSRLNASICAMHEEVLKQLARLPASFDAAWEQIQEVEKQAFTLFAEFGLTGLEFSLSGHDFKRILEIQEDQGKDAALSYIFEIFGEDNYFLLDELVSCWADVPYMLDRQKAVTFAIAAHKRAEYELTISTLLPWIDGLSAEIVSQFPNRKRKTIYVNDVAQMYKELEPESSSECLVQVVEKVLFQ